MRIIRNGKQANRVGRAQRKELVNGVGAKANKPLKVKDMVIRLGNVRIEWAKDAQKNDMGQRCPKGKL